MSLAIIMQLSSRFFSGVIPFVLLAFARGECSISLSLSCSWALADFEETDMSLEFISDSLPCTRFRAFVLLCHLLLAH